MAFPVASGFLADSLAFWLRGLAMGNAVGLLADSYALGAVEHLTSLVWAFDLAFGLLALNVADSVSGFSAGGVALGGFADWIADGWAVWVVALP